MHSRHMLMMTVSLTIGSGFVSAAPPPLPTPGTQALIDEVPGLMGIVGDQKVVGFFGPPIAETAEDSDPDSTRNFVNAFLAAHPDALGVDAVQLDLESEHTFRNGKFTVFTYSQRTSIDDLAVHGTIVKIVVLKGAMEKITYIGMNVLPVPEASLNRFNEILAQAAIDVATAAYSHLSFSLAAEDGTLFIVDGDTAAATDMLYTLDPTSGILTSIGHTGLDNGLVGLAYIPEPSTLALLLVGSVVSVRGRRLLRRGR